MTDLEGRVAVVTGANSGIGQQITIKLVIAGMKVRNSHYIIFSSLKDFFDIKKIVFFI